MMKKNVSKNLVHTNTYIFVDMEKMTLDRRETSFFSDIANTLVYNQESLKEFTEDTFSLQAFERQIIKKNGNYNHSFRTTLRDSIIQSYQGLDPVDAVVQNTLLLEKKDTFTITTGHQLNLFTGPLYFIYKIVHVIKMAEKLKEIYPDYNFVPVYWMASEDHDFAEINHLNLFGQKREWENDQMGPVGKFSLESFGDFKDEIKALFSNQPEIAHLIDESYQSEDDLARACFKLVNRLFGEKGLVIIDADRPELKALFRPVMFKEVREQFSNKEVESKTEELEKHGFTGQVYPREINLFFMEKGRRERIIKGADEIFRVGDDLKFTGLELLELIDGKPELISPNVVLRPVYQEWILPNLSYVGGGGEMAYWLQLKGVFDSLELLYPLIQVRNSVQIIDKTNQKKMEKLSYTFKDFLKSTDKLKKEFVLANSEDDLNFSELEELINQLEKLILRDVENVDKALEPYAKSEVVKINKQIDALKSKLIRHQKKKFDDTLKQIDKVNEKLFPGKGLQERHDNVLAYFSKFGIDNFLEILFKEMDSFEKDLIVLNE